MLFIVANCVAHRLISIESCDIDSRRLIGKENLNDIEYNTMSELIKSSEQLLQPGQLQNVIIDSFDVKPERLEARFQAVYPAIKITCQSKADLNFISVAAASILAKVERDLQMENLKKQINGIFLIYYLAHILVNVGSGYPADQITKAFVKGVISRRALGGIDL